MPANPWDALGLGLNSTVNALTIDGNVNLYAGGIFTSAGGELANRVAMWDGSTWNALGSWMSDRVTALAVHGSGDVYAGGSFAFNGIGELVNNIAKWDGEKWRALGPRVNDHVTTIDVGSLWAGGKSAGNIAQWNGPMGEVPEVSATALLERNVRGRRSDVHYADCSHSRQSAVQCSPVVVSGGRDHTEHSTQRRRLDPDGIAVLTDR